MTEAASSLDGKCSMWDCVIKSVFPIWYHCVNACERPLTSLSRPPSVVRDVHSHGVRYFASVPAFRVLFFFLLYRGAFRYILFACLLPQPSSEVSHPFFPFKPALLFLVRTHTLIFLFLVFPLREKY